MKLPYNRTYYRLQDMNLSQFTCSIYAAEQMVAHKGWVSDKYGKGEIRLHSILNLNSFTANIEPGFEKICTIEADLSNLRGSMNKTTNSKGTWWRVNFEVAFRFGSTALESRIIWKEGVSE